MTICKTLNCKDGCAKILFSRMKQALVTGGAGFIGSHMVEKLLKEGYEVTIFDNLSTGLKENIPNKVTFIEGDTSIKSDVDKAFEKDFDVVFHIAGCASAINSFTDPFNDIYANFIGTVNIVQKCIEKKVPRLLYASSMTIYGIVKELPVNETHPAVPISYYGISKYAAERYVHATGMRKDLPAPLQVTSFRMFNVYGPKQSLTNPYQGVMAIFIGNVLRNEPITIFGDGQQSRDFVYIDDVVDAWVASIDNKKAYGEVFNVGLGEDTSVNTLIKTIIQVLGKDPEIYPIIKKPGRPGDQRHMRADIVKITEALHWQPKYSLEKGLHQTLQWAKKQK